MIYSEMDYPRPQFVREGWKTLNGTWGFAFDDTDIGLSQGWNNGFKQQYEILVPFTYESEMSGINKNGFHPIVWYQRELLLSATDCENRLFLHFEGSDYETKIFLDGQMVGIHQGGYTRFTVELTDYVSVGSHTLVVRVRDSESMQQLRGKQRWKEESFGCWYVQTTGIWKSVWLERTAKIYLNSTNLTPLLDTYSIHLNAQVIGANHNTKLRINVTFGSTEILESTHSLGQMGDLDCTLSIYNTDVSEWGMKTWSPGQPNLYTIRYSVIENDETIDIVDSYFGMRKIHIEGKGIYLNGAKLYQRLILDQSYWPESHLTCPDAQALLDDIDKVIALGYNGIRMHQKIEDQRFYHYCDIKGVLVWCEAPSPYRYGDEMVFNFTVEWLSILKQFYNHPSIIIWTPINESWGIPMVRTRRQEQQFSEMVYHLTKSIDQMRPVIVNDGWEHTISDIITLHDYEECGEVLQHRYSEQLDKILGNEIPHTRDRKAFAKGYGYKGQPILISEYGGIAFADGAQGWGYGNKVQDEEAFLKRFESTTSAIQNQEDIVGFCYTQITDVQQEINGLLDCKRRNKVSSKRIYEINTRRNL